MNQLERLYREGRYAEGRRLQIAIGMARGGSAESGGAVIERAAEFVSQSPSVGQRNSPQRLTAPVSKSLVRVVARPCLTSDLAAAARNKGRVPIGGAG